MDRTYLPPTRSAAPPSVGTLFAQFPVVCFTLTLLTDLAFWRTSNLMWQNFSSWLLFAGLVGGGLAVVAGIIKAVSGWREGARGPGWPHALGGLMVLALAVVNSFVHAGDGWTAVVPYGLLLSALTVLLMIATAWLGRVLAVPHAAGVRSHA